MFKEVGILFKEVGLVAMPNEAKWSKRQNSPGSTKTIIIIKSKNSGFFGL